MAVRFWSSFISRIAVPVSLPAWKPCNTSWNVIAAVSLRFKMLNIVFQITSTSPIPLKFPHFPLGIRTTVYHVHS